MISGDQTKTAGEPSYKRLYVIGGLTAVVYLGMCIFYIGGPESRSRTGKEVAAWLCVLSLLPLFYKGYQTIKDASDHRTVKTIICFSALFCLITFLTVPYHSTDVFGYINRGWQQVHYGQNPYVVRLADIPGWQDDPMMREHWLYNPTPYGFLFSLLARALAFLGGGNWWLTLALFKLVNIAAFAATAWLVWSGAKLLGHARPVNALYLYLWNPLILVHHIANGHNDVLTGFAITLALYLTIRGAYLWVIPALVCATLLKYGPVLLIPLAAIYIYKKKGLRPVALGTVIGGVIGAAVSLPYLKDWRQFRLEDIRDNATLIDNSLHSFLIHIYENLSKLITPLAQAHDVVNTIISTTLRAGFVLFFIVILYKMLRSETLEDFLEKSMLILFVLICVVSSKFNAWYLGMLLPGAFYLAERHWLRRLTVLTSAAELASITFFKQAYILNYFAMLLVPTWVVYRQERRAHRNLAANGQSS